MNKIYSQKDFVTVLERERVRADRTGREFSMIIYAIHNAQDPESLSHYLLHVISQRIRCYDATGWIDENRIGILLPDTPAKGACQLANDICCTVIPKTRRPRYTVLTYPSNWPHEFSSGAREQGAGSSPNSSSGSGKDNATLMNMLGSILPGRLPLWKRAMDVLFAVSGLVVIFPVLLLTAAFIKIVSPGPALFKQRRVGYLGQTFTCWKFRTMKTGAEAAVHQSHMNSLISNGHPMNKLDDRDPRIIPCGRLMRKLGLDELPQLVNVIRGEMSLIGPRPCIPYEARHYENWQCRRFDSFPGLTGLWQVSGKNRTTFDEMMRLDIAYGRKRSFWLDVKILLKTPLAIILQALPFAQPVKARTEQYARPAQIAPSS